jgi:lysophospholipase L1-like esterase
MAFAIRYLEVHPSTSLVTIDIGANDAFVCQETTPDQCTSPSELEALVAQVKGNLESILQQIRDVAGYQGTIVTLTYYSTDYADGLLDAETELLNRTIASATHAYGGLIANGYAAFQGPSTKFGGSPCAAGLLIKIPGGCNIHPSPEGHLLLAAVIAKALGD